MKRYSLTYNLNSKEFTSSVDAKDAKSAERKILNKYNATSKQIKFENVSVIGYY